jgi:hypothetical protein
MATITHTDYTHTSGDGMVKVVGALLYQTWYQPVNQLRQPGVECLKQTFLEPFLPR